MIWAVAVLGGTDVGFAEACTNAHSGVCVVMCQTAAGSKQSNAIVGIAAETRRTVSTSTAPEVYIGLWPGNVERARKGGEDSQDFNLKNPTEETSL